jgi:lipopolysaccharide transport system ATP-binding protein
MSDLLYSFKNIGLCYHKGASLPWRRNYFWALHDVSFDVHRGETIGIVGKNGAGKSSLLRIIAGIIEPDKGTFEKHSDVKASLQSLNAGFNSLLSGRQNIFLSGLMLGMKKDRIRSHEAEIIELSELGEFIDAPVVTYSSGMKSRLGFAIAYFMNPEVLLIDEALAVGDVAFKQKSAALLRAKVKQDNTTAIIVSHSPALMDGLCDRIICIEHGKNLPELSVDESLSKYLNYKRPTANQ